MDTKDQDAFYKDYSNTEGVATSGPETFGPCVLRIGYCGYVHDPNFALRWLARNRWYDSDLGRFISRDPSGYADGLSMYLYVHGNPFMLVDPTGLDGEPPEPLHGGWNDTPAFDGTWHHYYTKETRWFGGLIPYTTGYRLIPSLTSFTPKGQEIDDHGRTEYEREVAAKIGNGAHDARIGAKTGVRTAGAIASWFTPTPEGIALSIALKYGARGFKFAADKVFAVLKNGQKEVQLAAHEARMVELSSKGVQKELKEFNRGNRRANGETIFGKEAGKGHDLHHIIAENDERAEAARGLLDKFGIHINDPPLNGVFLDKEFHRGIHTNAYYRYIEKGLRDAKNRDEALEFLEEMAKKLKEAKNKDNLPWEKK